MIMLHELGKPPNDVKSYRQIFLLPMDSKVFEKLFSKSLKPILEEDALIPDHQFGIRKKYTTVEYIE